jgi:hypothetical protein
MLGDEVLDVSCLTRGATTGVGLSAQGDSNDAEAERRPPVEFAQKAVQEDRGKVVGDSDSFFRFGVGMVVFEGRVIPICVDTVFVYNVKDALFVDNVFERSQALEGRVARELG